MASRVHIIAEGLVQGVGFRWFAHQKAQAYGVNGWVRNLVDGNVEIEAEGEKETLVQFIQELQRGPRSAHVRNLQVEWLESHGQVFSHFQIR